MDLAWPFHFDERGRTATVAGARHVRQMIEQLLFTNPGERVNRPEFGSGLRQLVFAPNSPELAATLQFTMKAAVQQWLGDVVRLDELEVTASDSTLRIDIVYSLPATGEQRTETLERNLP
jgi:phage baseplate assembly protein W